MIITALTTTLAGFLISMLIGPIIIKFCKKLKINQNVSEYVVEHQTKQGTPTMGGLIFLIPMLLISFIFFLVSAELAIICIATLIGYGIIGFLDDYLKIKFKQNEGLKPYQKILGQGFLSLIIAIYAYNSAYVGTEILIPFTDISINLGWWIIPFIMLVFLATTNSVNLTDGLDGLAGGVSLVFCITFGVIIAILTIVLQKDGGAVDLINQYQNLIAVCSGLAGALLGYLWFNAYPAKIFMGDTGSLALGGIFATIAIFTRMELYLIIVGFMFVLSSVSVIMQVIYYKITKKRIFLMAPFHHHLQKKGLNETKIVSIYIIISAVVGLVTCLGVMLALL